MAELPESTIYIGLKFDVSVFRMADNKLRIDDKISLIFLLFEDSSEALSKATLVIKSQDTSYNIVDILLLWTKNCELLWRQMFLEALIIIKSFDVINNILDLDWKTVNRYYPMDSFHTAYIHPVKKCLHAISESMDQEETHKVILEFWNVFETPNMIFEKTDIMFFEIFILKLIKWGFIELGTWNCKPINPASLNEARVEGLKFIFMHLHFTELYDLLSAIVCQFNKLILRSHQLNRGFEEDQVIISARLLFNSWVEKGLMTVILRMRASSKKDKGGPQLGSSRIQGAHVEENLEAVPIHVIDEESQNNYVIIGELMHSLSRVDTSENSNQHLTIAVASGEQLQRATNLQQGNEESMNLDEEFEKMDLGDENSDDLTLVLSTCFVPREKYSVDTDVPRIHMYADFFQHEKNYEPFQVECLKVRPNAINEEKYVTNAFKSLNFNDYVLRGLNHSEIEFAFTFIDQFKENPSVFVFFMVCYGLKGHLVSANNDLVRREEVERVIARIPELVGKPKILVTQTYMLDDVRFPERVIEKGAGMVDLLSLWVSIPYHMQEGGSPSPFESDLQGVSMFLKIFGNHLEVMDNNKDFVSLCHDVCSEVMQKTNGALMPTYVSYLSKLLYLKP